MEERFLQALRAAGHPLRTPVADADTTDLQPLKEIFGDARIVGLGESTHGTREFFQLKHRLVRFLVEEMGFRTFAIEAGLEPVRRINEYVTGGKGDKYRALSAQSYWTWDTAEVIDMIDWMRDHNLRCRPGQECRFCGIDMKPIEGACDSLISYLRPIAGEAGKDLVREILDTRGTAWMTDGQQLPVPEKVLGWLKLHELQLVRLSSPEEYALAVEDAIYACQFIACMKDYLKGSESPLGERDFYMTENVDRLLRKLPKGSRIVLWAHNGHIAADPEWNSMGWQLRQRFGSGYFPCGLCFGKGGFQSRYVPFDEEGNMRLDVFGGLRGFTFDRFTDAFWEKDLNDAFSGNAYLDLRHPASADFAEWSKGKKYLFSAGAAYSDPPEIKAHEEPPMNLSGWLDAICQNVTIAEHFDALFFLKTVARARPNINGQR